MSCCCLALLLALPGYPKAGSAPPSPPAMAPLLDGAIELLNLLPQTLCLILQSCPLLLQLADVLGCLLQGGGLADLGDRGVREEGSPDHPCTAALCACCVLQPPAPQAGAQERSSVLWVTAGMQHL